MRSVRYARCPFFQCIKAASQILFALMLRGASILGVAPGSHRRQAATGACLFFLMSHADTWPPLRCSVRQVAQLLRSGAGERPYLRSARYARCPFSKGSKAASQILFAATAMDDDPPEELGRRRSPGWWERWWVQPGRGGRWWWAEAYGWDFEPRPTGWRERLADDGLELCLADMSLALLLCISCA